MPPRWILPLAIALVTTKLLLVVALDLAHDRGVTALDLAAALAPEVGIALVAALFAATVRSEIARRLVASLLLVLLIVTWLSAAAWAYAGTPISWELFRRLVESPQALATAARTEDGYLTIALALLALAGALGVGSLFARVARTVAARMSRRLPLPVGTARRGFLLAGVAVALALAAPWTRRGTTDPLRAPTFLAALGVDDPLEPDAPLDREPGTVRALSPPSPLASVPLPGIANVVILVLESARFEPTTALSRGFPDAIHYDRVYAHHPRSVKTLEALFFGIYPSPSRSTAAWAIDRYDVEAMGPLPALLRRHGFGTSYLGSTNLLFDGYGRALERAGFDSVERTQGGEELTWGVTADALFARVGDILEAGRRDGTRQLVAAWTTECHRPYDFRRHPDDAPGPRDDGLRGRYLACLDSLAGSLQRFLGRLEGSGAVNDTLVVALGDHGQTFGEDHPGELAFGQHVWEQSLRVPVLLFLPPEARRAFAERGGNPAAHDERLFQIVDVPRTIAGVLGFPISPAWVGHDMLDPRAPGRDIAFVVSILDPRIVGSVDRDGRKQERARDGRLLALDLTQDPGESSPRELAGAEADTARAKLDTYLAIAAEGWEGRLRHANAPEVFSGQGLLAFGRTGPCVEAKLDPATSSLVLEPRAHPDCGDGSDLPLRRFVPTTGRGPIEVRVNLRLRLLGELPDGDRTLRAKARVGRRSSWSAQALQSVAGTLQEVVLSVRVPRRAGTGAKRRRGGFALELVPVDPLVPCAIESIALEVATDATPSRPRHALAR